MPVQSGVPSATAEGLTNGVIIVKPANGVVFALSVVVAAAGTILVNDATTSGAVDNSITSTNNCLAAISSASLTTILLNMPYQKGLAITVPASVVCAVSYA